jgi:hypothetical protein
MSSAQINNPIEITVDIDEDANTTPFTFTVPRALTVADVIVLTTAAGTSATLSSAGGDITDAIAAVGTNAVTRAGEIDPANATVAAGATLTITGGTTAFRGTVTILCHAAGETL